MKMTSYMENNPGSLVDVISRVKRQGASEEDVKKTFNRYMDILARKKAIPLRGEFELTPLCNLDCKMCYVHLKEKEFSSKKLISVSKWKQLINEAHNAGMMYATLTGGECLTYPWFDELYLYMRNMGIIPSILSNGLLFDVERIEFFKKYPPNLIRITLYGSSNDAYERVTGHRVFDRIYHNLELLRESHLKVSLALTPSVYMMEDMRSLQEVAQSLGFPYGINVNLIEPRGNTGRERADLETEQYIEMYRIWKELNDEELIPKDPIELPDESKFGKSVYGLVCGGGKSAFTIQYNGKMSPCASLAEVATDPFDEGFLNAWHRLNRLVSEYPMPAECPECVYHEYCLPCPAIHSNAHNVGHCDPRVCERTKRLIQEGFIEFSCERED